MLFRSENTGESTWTEEELIQGADDTEWTSEAVNTRINYRCVVSNIYGQTESVTFELVPDTHISIEVDGEWEKYVAPNDSVELKVNVTSDDSEHLTYSWTRYTYDPDSGETYTETVAEGSSATNIYTVENVAGYEEYYVSVSDRFNSTGTWFRVWPQTELKVEVDEIVYTSDDTITREVEYGQTETMSVSATASEGVQISYKWYKHYETDTEWTEYEEIIELEGENSVISEAITGLTEYQCEIRDNYNNSKIGRAHV